MACEGRDRSVTPEVAGSSPVAPVEKGAGNSAFRTFGCEFHLLGKPCVERVLERLGGLLSGRTRGSRRPLRLKLLAPSQGRNRRLGYAANQRLGSGRVAGLAFGTTAEKPFAPSAVWRRARRAWTQAGLSPIGLHEARHTFASLMIAAGVNAKALATYMGHSSVTITFDRYGRLMPGNEGEAGALLDAYLAAN